jgi:hypothetical protein
VDVPELAGMTVEEATEALADVGLEARPRHDEGTVDGSEPSAGSSVEVGEEVLLWVEAPPREISGVGNDVTDPFQIDNNVIIWSFTHDGGSNFAIEAFDAEGQGLGVLVNRIGRYDGEVVQEVPTGEVNLEITADGNWTAQLRQPTFLNTEQLPVEVQGTGDGTTPIFEGEGGRSTVTYSHQGESNFVVEAYDDFERVGVLVNEIGTTEGSVGASFNDDLAYIVDVTADGPWTIVIE